MTEAQSARRARHLKATYGITPADFDAVYQAQAGQCAICPKALRHPDDDESNGVTPNIDHDHKSGVVRGLLCAYCNRYRIGRERDPEMFANAAAYLRFPPAVAVLGERVVPPKPKKKRRRR